METKTNTAKTAKPAKACTEKGCKRPYRAKGYCDVHFKKWRRGELEAKPRFRTCGEENCKKPAFNKNMCEQHYGAWLASKRPQVPVAAEKPGAAAEEKPAS